MLSVGYTGISTTLTDVTRHERMHLTLKHETARPPAANIIQQQERFDAFQAEFDPERPHERRSP